jgi:hypothetical protein
VQPRRVNEAHAVAAVAAPEAPPVPVARIPAEPQPAPRPARAEPAPAVPRAEPPMPRAEPLRERPAAVPARPAPASQASRTERARANSLESLDSISVDIARMIDHDAAVELWDRYKRGERNVFTRRLYTIQGQQTFDEIRRRYRGDAEFRQTVDRYVAEFERLIAEVSRDDRDQGLAKTYLTSETGKVYTMLAHASGRFE